MQLILEAILSHPNPDLSRPSGPQLPCRASTAQSRIPSSQHFVRNTVGQTGLAVGWGSLCCNAPASPCGARGLGPRLCTVVSSWLHSSLVLYEHLHLVDKVPGNPQDLLRVVTLSTFIEELDDVCEVHIVVADNLTVGLHQGQGNEQDKVLR